MKSITYKNMCSQQWFILILDLETVLPPQKFSVYFVWNDFLYLQGSLPAFNDVFENY